MTRTHTFTRTRAKHKYGWHKAHGDIRDRAFKLTAIHPHVASVQTFAPALSLRSGYPFAPFDQGQLGSCGPHATEAALTFDQKKQGAIPMMLSILFLYWFTRYIEGGIDQTQQDSGVNIRDLFKAYNRYGICPETEWPYADEGDKFTIQPPPLCITDAKAHRAIQYMGVDLTEQGLKQALTAGYPVVLGITVYDSFQSDDAANTGMIAMPTTKDQVDGGHAIDICGWDDTKFNGQGAWEARNSWGVDWGDQGYFWLPKQYLLDPDLASDAWSLEHVS